MENCFRISCKRQIIQVNGSFKILFREYFDGHFFSGSWNCRSFEFERCARRCWEDGIKMAFQLKFLVFILAYCLFIHHFYLWSGSKPFRRHTEFFSDFLTAYIHTKYFYLNPLHTKTRQSWSLLCNANKSICWTW